MKIALLGSMGLALILSLSLVQTPTVFGQTPAGGAPKGGPGTGPDPWLGILAEAPPSPDGLVPPYYERGFALYTMRSQKITRL
jgi:hypothetical protein